MKKCKILPLLGILFMMSSIFGSCKEDKDIDHSIPSTEQVPIKLTATLVKEIPIIDASTSKAFSVNAGHSRDQKYAEINWTTDLWDDEANKPKLICVVRNKTDHTVKQCREIDRFQYHYENDYSNNRAIITISTLMDKADLAKDELVFYVFDKSQGADIQSKSGTIDFDGEAMLYDITRSPVIFQKKIGANTFVEPSRRTYFNFIFSGSIDYGKYLNSSRDVNTFNMYPVGSLLMVDFKSKSEEMKNPADFAGFNPTLGTNAFDMTGKIDLVTGKSTTARSKQLTTSKIHFISYNNNNNITDRYNTNSLISKTNPSPVYVKYVLPRDNESYSINISNDKVSLFTVNKLENFFVNNNSKTVDIRITLEKKDIPPSNYKIIPYNALSYMAEKDVNKAQDGFTTTDPYEAVSLSLSEYNPSIFNKEFLKGYHLPDPNDWASIANGFVSTNDYPYGHKIVFYGSISYDGMSHVEYGDVKIGKAILSNIQSIYYNKTSTTDVYGYTANHHTTYAIRYISAVLSKDENGHISGKDLTKGNCPYLSLWRYEYRIIDRTEAYVDIYCYVVPNNAQIDEGSHTIDFGDGKGPQDFTTRDFFESRIQYGSVHRILYPAKGRDKNNYILSDYDGVTLNKSESENFTGGEDLGLYNIGNVDGHYTIRPFLNPIE